MGGWDQRRGDGDEPRVPLSPVTAASATAQGLSAAGGGVPEAAPSKRKVGIAKLVQGIRQRLQPVARRQQTADYDTAAPKQSVYCEGQQRDDKAIGGRRRSDVPAGSMGADSRARTARTASAGQDTKGTGSTGPGGLEPDQARSWAQAETSRREWAEVAAAIRRADNEKAKVHSAEAAAAETAAAAAGKAAEAAVAAEAAKAATAEAAAKAAKEEEAGMAARAAKAAEAEVDKAAAAANADEVAKAAAAMDRIRAAHAERETAARAEAEAAFDAATAARWAARAASPSCSLDERERLLDRAATLQPLNRRYASLLRRTRRRRACSRAASQLGAHALALSLLLTLAATVGVVLHAPRHVYARVQATARSWWFGAAFTLLSGKSCRSLEAEMAALAVLFILAYTAVALALLPRHRRRGMAGTAVNAVRRCGRGVAGVLVGGASQWCVRPCACACALLLRASLCVWYVARVYAGRVWAEAGGVRRRAWRGARLGGTTGWRGRAGGAQGAGSGRPDSEARESRPGGWREQPPPAGDWERHKWREAEEARDRQRAEEAASRRAGTERAGWQHQTGSSAADPNLRRRPQGWKNAGGGPPPPPKQPAPPPPRRPPPVEPAGVSGLSPQQRAARLPAGELRRVLLASSHYQVLGVDRGAGSVELKKAFHRLALRLHPDKNPDELACEAFQVLQQAHAVLSDAQRRSEYDRILAGRAFRRT
jgi:chemotaxis protein histidine kinase CheA